MANLVCKACNVSKAAPNCPKCSTEEQAVGLGLGAEAGKASCGNCGLVQALPKHCGWDMTID